MAFRQSLCGKDVPWKSQYVQVTDSRPPTRQQVLGCCLKRIDKPAAKEQSCQQSAGLGRPFLGFFRLHSRKKLIDRGTPDPKHFCGSSFIAANTFEHTKDVPALQFFQRKESLIAS